MKRARSLIPFCDGTSQPLLARVISRATTSRGRSNSTSARRNTLPRVHFLRPSSSLDCPGSPRLASVQSLLRVETPRRDIFGDAETKSVTKSLCVISLAKILFTWTRHCHPILIPSRRFPPRWQWGCNSFGFEKSKTTQILLFPASERFARSIGRDAEQTRLVQSCREKVTVLVVKIFPDALKVAQKRCAARFVLSFLAFEPGIQVSVTIPIQRGEQNRVICRTTCGDLAQRSARARTTTRTRTLITPASADTSLVGVILRSPRLFRTSDTVASRA